jgi:hypothetical protein
LCCDTYVKSKYLTSQVSTTATWNIKACSPVSNDELKGNGRDIWYVDELQRKKGGTGLS